MKILVINGPNMNMLGIREPEIYGNTTYAGLTEYIKKESGKKGIETGFFQSNHEGALVDAIQEALGTFDGIVINPAAYTHTSVAILDAVKSTGLPAVEVHISDPDKREEFRKVSYIREGCIATVKGKGINGYIEAVDILADYINGKKF